MWGWGCIHLFISMVCHRFVHECIRERERVSFHPHMMCSLWTCVWMNFILNAILSFGNKVISFDDNYFSWAFANKLACTHTHTLYIYIERERERTTYTYWHVHAATHAQTHTYIQMHTHTHTHTHTHIAWNVIWLLFLLKHHLAKPRQYWWNHWKRFHCNRPSGKFNFFDDPFITFTELKDVKT